MKTLLFTSIVALAILSSCSEDKICLKGDGTVNDYDLELSTFDQVSLIGPVNLSITQGSTQSVSVRAESEMMDNLEYKVNNQNLRIGFEESVNCFETDYGVWVDVTVLDIASISITGVSEVVSNGDLQLDEVTIQASGVADVSLSGTANKQIIDAEGVLNVYNFDLLTKTTSIFISGVGNLDVNCSDNLDMDIKGVAVVRYKGTPTISKSVSGSLELIDKN